MNLIKIYDIFNQLRYEHEEDNNTPVKTLHAMIHDDINCRDLNLNGLDLSHSRLMSVDFTGSSFVGVNAINTNFSESILNGTYFASAAAIKANFSHTKLIEAIFSGTNCMCAKFSNTVLDKAIFENTNLTEADFYMATFINTKMDNNCTLTNANFYRALINPSNSLYNITDEQRYWARPRS